MDIIQKTDEALFRFINIDLANPLTDKLMPFITERDNWYIFYVIIWLFLFFKGGTKGKVSAVMVIILILFCDQISAFILKEIFQRIRPCHVISNVNLLIGCSDSFSFPSNHAVNNFAAATLFSYFYRNMKYVLFSGAFLVAISRVFCGVHYPFDMICGALIGILIAMFFLYLWKKLNKKFKLI